MIKSPLRYPGGKSRAIKMISKLIPEFGEYREPFLGGGSVFLYLKQTFPQKKFWINDLYFELFKFWEVSQKNMPDLINQVNIWKEKYNNGRDLHNFLKENISDFGDTQRAAAFFIFNRITFSGTTLSGGYSEAAFKGRFTISSIERLNTISNVLNDTVITNLDYKDLVLAEGKDVFLFLDPPYYSATKSALYGENGNLHKSFNHNEFAETMRKCDHKWLITYDDSEYIRDLFSFADIIPWSLTYGMRNVNESSNQKGKEIFISNYIGDTYETKDAIQLNLFGREI